MSQWRDVLIKAGKDSAFRDRLKANPLAAGKEAGVSTPAGISVEVIEHGRHDLNLMLGCRSGVPAIDQVVKQAENDTSFRQKLKSDGRTVVESALGQRLPAETKVRLLEPSADRIQLLLPAEAATDCELSDQELETVAGGTLRGLLTRIGNALCRDSTTESYPGYTGGMITTIVVTVDNSVSNTTTVY